MAQKRQPFPIVGVGASAGGVEALEGFFQGLASQPGLAFIVVTHLSPDRESLLHEIVARYTDMTVEVAEHGAEVRPNRVYVLPADAIISVEDDHLHLRKSRTSRRERKPIDILFSSLAIDQGEYAASVVLSGGDGDGTLGTKAIKERGGLTLAQVADGHGPQHASMPDSAISTGFVDFAVPVEEMGAKLVEFARLLSEPAGAIANFDRSEARLEICAILRNQVGHDFAGYKTKTFFRRVQRRMQVVQAQSETAYIQRLQDDPKEVGALFRDLLINVTNFFRDAEAFDQLRDQVIPRLFEGKGAQDLVRVWVPGCSTGEEVFSVAILLREHMDTLTVTPQVQVFATDIDEHALGVARAGRYPEALLDSVSQERRNRYFIPEGGSFLLTKEVRDLCIFSPHSVIRDPPFSRLDLVSCRNLLIYFGAEAQDAVLPTFHYALKEGGYLFLGLSESIGRFAELFAAVDKKHRIFRSRSDAALESRLPVNLRHNPVAGLAALDKRQARPAPAPTSMLRQSLEAQVLERFAPAHVLVTRDGDVVHFSARTNRYLELAPGAPTRQLMALARKQLRIELRAAFREALVSDEAVTRDPVPLSQDDGSLQMVAITVEPLVDRQGGDPLYVVLFADRGPSLSPEQAQQRVPATDSGITLLLERELRDSKERLQSLIEEYETALEELRSSNEELLSVNEELQSSNEEMEASKEELQSLNEELNTVNAELNAKVDALDRANNDLYNLFDSTQIPTVFLDRQLVIRSFTPAVASLFNIRPGDRGRPLTDLSSRLPLPEFIDDIHAVLNTRELIEREIDLPDGSAHFILRLSPYLGVGGDVDGVVVSFLDVTRLAKAQSHQKTLIAELNHRVKNMLMIAIGLAQQTHNRSPSPEAFIEAFIGRLQAMARSYELLSREHWIESPLREVVHVELAPFGEDRFTLEGEDLTLQPRQALSLGMVLHELATNAAKYGALSSMAGQVTVRWRRVGAKEKVLELEWSEAGGPPVPSSPRKGFGLDLVEKETAYSLRGQTTTAFEADGLQVHIQFPMEKPS